MVWDRPLDNGIPDDDAAEYNWIDILDAWALTRDTASTTCISAYVPGPQKEALDDTNVNEMA